MFQPIKIFRSDIKVILRPLSIILFPIWGMVFIWGIFNFYENGFSEISDFLFLIFFPLILYLAIYLFLLLMKFVFPVEVFHNGIKCYNYFGFYRFIKWEEITNAYIESVEGFKYIYVETSDLKSPLTIPLFLDDMDEFIALIRKKDSKGILAQQYKDYSIS